MNPKRKGRDFIARHGETVFNAARRMQGRLLHTPLTRAGFAQAEEMGEALGPRPALALWASPTGRALQTLAVIAEHLELDWHQAHTDERLGEIDIGSWDGRHYHELAQQFGPMIDPESGALTPAPDGETYPAIAARLSGWLADTDDAPVDRLVITHGISGMVLRGVMTGRKWAPSIGAPLAPALPQGSVVMIERGRETIVHRGRGEG